MDMGVVRSFSCDECGMVHGLISRADAIRRIKADCDRFDRTPIERRGDAPSIADYEHCKFCGNGSERFSPSNDEPEENAWIIHKEQT